MAPSDGLPRAPIQSLSEAQRKHAAKSSGASNPKATSGAQDSIDVGPGGRPMTWIGLRHLHVPENRRSELEHVADVLAEGRRLEPFPPRHVGHFAESDFL